MVRIVKEREAPERYDFAALGALLRDGDAGDWSTALKLSNAWLRDALAAAARRYKFAPTSAALDRLVNLPQSVDPLPRSESAPSPDLLADIVRASADDFAALDAAIAFNAQRPLTKAQHRRRGRQFAAFAMEEGRVLPRGRPPEVNMPALLFLIFTIEELMGCRSFPTSRPKPAERGQARPPGGPAFRLLMAASAFAAAKHRTPPPDAETVHSAVLRAKAAGYRRRLEKVRQAHAPWPVARQLTDAETVAAWPAECVWALAISRRSTE